MTNDIEWPRETDAIERDLKSALLNRRWWSREGEFVRRFQDSFATFLDVKHVSCCSSGTSALEIALKSLDIGFLEYVIVPSITFLGSAIPVLKVGALPLFADVDPETACIDPKSIENLIHEHGNKIKAIIVVHLGGQSCAMDSIMSIAEKNGIRVIEDCAQAIGAFYKGKHVGGFGDLGCFSFQNSKNITSGEGGAITTNDHQVSIKVRKYLDYNFDETAQDTEFKYLSGNNRLSEFQGAVLLSQIQEFGVLNSTREENYRVLAEIISGIPGLMPMSMPEGQTKHGCHFLMFRYQQTYFKNKSKTDFMEYLNRNGIPCFGGYDHIPLNRYHYFKDSLYLKNDPLWRGAYQRMKFDLPEQLDCQAAFSLSREFVWIPQFVLLRDTDTLKNAIRSIENFRE